MDSRANHPGDPRNTRAADAASASATEPPAAPTAAELAPFELPVAAAATSSSDNQEIMSIDGFPASSRPVSPILGSDDLRGDDRSSPPSSPTISAATKKEEDLPALGQEQHIDEPEDLAWLRPLQCVQARGGDDPERSITNAIIYSYPAPADELLSLDSQEIGKLHYNDEAKWYVQIHWTTAGYSEWLPCGFCHKEFNRRDRKRAPPARHTIGPTSAATERNALLKASAPQKLGSKKRPIKIDEEDNGGNGTKVTRSKRKSASGSRACSAG